MAAGLAYSVYHIPLNAIAAELQAAGAESMINSATGPGGVLAIFRAAGQPIGKSVLFLRIATF
jgi:hypothetical protein